MSISPAVRANLPSHSGCKFPYEDYAELLSKLLPSVQTICFYDRSSRARWMTDDIEVPELTAQVEKVLLQAIGAIRYSHTSHTDSDITHIAAIRGPDDSVQGALALIIGRGSSGNKSGRLRPYDVEAAISPVLRILGHMPIDSEPQPTPLAPVNAAIQTVGRRVQHDPFVGTAARAMSTPVILRRLLSTAVSNSSCSFGALIAAERQHTLVHRGTEQEQLLSEMSQIVESMRSPIAALVGEGGGALAVNSPEQTWGNAFDYKLIVSPVRKADGELVAMLALFRRSGHDFDSASCLSLQDLALRIPAHVLEELTPLPKPPDPQAIESQTRQTVTAITTPARIELSLDKRLRMALREDGFDLHVQTIVPLQQSSAATRCEVLLRMRQGDALQLPRTFLETAAQNGLLPDIDRWVIGHLLTAVRPHSEALQAGHWEFALNVSAASLQRESFGDFLEAQLFRSGVPPQALMLEFAEHDVIAHLPLFESLAPRLAALGCRIALDNCRQGLDIFLSTGRLPVHRLKIDATLTQHVTSDTRVAHTVRELVEVARDVGIETVGERIENEETRQMLRELGVDFAQGFIVAQPRPLTELLQ